MAPQICSVSRHEKHEDTDQALLAQQPYPDHSGPSRFVFSQIMNFRSPIYEHGQKE